MQAYLLTSLGSLGAKSGVITIKLTKNEKKTLKLLLENGRASDTDIADQLRITKQAVGKIRHKLEESSIITRYSAELDFTKLGVGVFALEMLTINSRCEKGNNVCQDLLLQNPHVIKMCKLPEQNRFATFYAFRDLNELENFFKKSTCNDPSNSHSNCIEHSPIQIFPGSSVLKNCPRGLLNKVIEEF